MKDSKSPFLHDDSRPGLLLRSYSEKDVKVVHVLYEQGLLAGQLAPNDSGADLDFIEEAYFDAPEHHLWVAEHDEQVIGMIGVGSDDRNTGEIRRLRILPDWQKSDAAQALLEVAVNHCKKHGFLKLRLDTRFEASEAKELFDNLGFQHTRTRKGQGKETLEFYLDLYRRDKP